MIFCAFLAPDAIPCTLFIEAPFLEPNLKNALEPPNTIYDTTSTLQQLLLIDYDSEMQTLTVNPVLQAVIKEGMYETDGDKSFILRSSAEYAVRAIDHQIKNSMSCPRRVVRGEDGRDKAVDQIKNFTFNNWNICCQYLPHASACCEHIDKHNLMFPEAMRLLYITGRFLLECGKYEEAEKLLTRSLTLEVYLSDENYPSMAMRYIALGELYHLQGKYQEAGTQYELALNTTNLKITRAIIFTHQGQLNNDLGNDKEAEELYDSALGILTSEESFNEMLQKAIIWNNQGSLALKTNLYNQAHECYLKALKIFKKLLGGNHPNTLQCKANLATLEIMYGNITRENDYVTIAGNLLEQEKDEMLNAEQCYKDTLQANKEILGENRAQQANRLYNLAELYHLQGKMDEAKENFRQALNIYDVLNLDHPMRAKIIKGYKDLLIEMNKDGSSDGELQRLEEQAKRISSKYTLTALSSQINPSSIEQKNETNKVGSKKSIELIGGQVLHDS